MAKISILLLLLTSFLLFALIFINDDTFVSAEDDNGSHESDLGRRCQRDSFYQLKNENGLNVEPSEGHN
ncbi:hypothetical protein C5167_024800 [Papaver somniferum]|uniref:Phytosulfokine-beta n=1 Tax=Papaver somniferum TaxID=3469 RepID=A0A4Y7JQP8_PAPSO|nr:hypothetical protein C5167_024800 [Papaver somniferum]